MLTKKNRARVDLTPHHAFEVAKYKLAVYGVVERGCLSLKGEFRSAIDRQLILGNPKGHYNAAPSFGSFSWASKKMNACRGERQKDRGVKR